MAENAPLPLVFVLVGELVGPRHPPDLLLLGDRALDLPLIELDLPLRPDIRVALLAFL